MLHKLIRTLLCGLAPLIVCQGLQAQNELSLGALKAGEIALNLNLTEQQQADQDTLNASLEYVTQGRNRQDLQNEVNKVMQQALSSLQRHSELDFNTGYYRVNIVQTGRPSRTDIEKPVFRAQQSLNITSTDSATLLTLLAELQEAGLTMNGLYYSLSSETHDAISSELTTSALLKLKSRAEDTAEVLGLGSAKLVEITMNADSALITGSRMRAMMSSVENEFSVPVADPGETTVTVRISARAILSP